MHIDALYVTTIKTKVNNSSQKELTARRRSLLVEAPWTQTCVGLEADTEHAAEAMINRCILFSYFFFIFP